jgi:hypothetical protein
VIPSHIRKLRSVPNVGILGDRYLKRLAVGQCILHVRMLFLDNSDTVGVNPCFPWHTDAWNRDMLVYSDDVAGEARSRCYTCFPVLSVIAGLPSPCTLCRVPLVSSCRIIFWISPLRWCCSRKTVSESHLTLNNLVTQREKNMMNTRHSVGPVITPHST